MQITRRRFLAGTAGALLLGQLPLGCTADTSGLPTPPSHAPELRAQEGSVQLTPPEYPETPVWGYGGSVPGPQIRVPQGQRVSRLFVNDLPQPSTVHWHGVRLVNAMDGVPELTQTVVPPGKSYLYEFEAPDAGTFWYHPHDRAWEQMARGLYGALIVEEPEPPFVDHDEVLLLDDWYLTAEADFHPSFGAAHDWAHAGRLGNWLTINGEGNWTRTTRQHERWRLRLVNTSNARVLPLEVQGLAGWLVALDGQPLSFLQQLSHLQLAPAQRADLIVDVVAQEGEEATLTLLQEDRGILFGTFAVNGVGRADRLPEPEPLPANPVPPLGDLEATRSASLLMEGGAMGGMQQAMLDGRNLKWQQLLNRNKFWAMNGVANVPDDPLLNAAVGETVRIRIINDTVWPHAMHLHGHHFRRVTAEGTHGPLRDTLLLEREESAEIAFVADNPGDWLLHCHMLEHSDGGMKTWLRVA